MRRWHFPHFSTSPGLPFRGENPTPFPVDRRSALPAPCSTVGMPCVWHVPEDQSTGCNAHTLRGHLWEDGAFALSQLPCTSTNSCGGFSKVRLRHGPVCLGQSQFTAIDTDLTISPPPPTPQGPEGRGTGEGPMGLTVKRTLVSGTDLGLGLTSSRVLCSHLLCLSFFFCEMEKLKITHLSPGGL